MNTDTEKVKELVEALRNYSCWAPREMSLRDRAVNTLESLQQQLTLSQQAQEQAERERDRWRIECERLANGMLETFEDEATEAGVDVIAPEQAVDAAFGLMDKLAADKDALARLIRQRAELAEQRLSTVEQGQEKA